MLPKMENSSLEGVYVSEHYWTVEFIRVKLLNYLQYKIVAQFNGMVKKDLN